MRRPLLALLINLCALTGCIPSIGDIVTLSPHWDWKTIETTHFRVHYPAQLADTAQKAAAYLEDAHAVLSPHLRWTPRYKVPILVVDNEDSANGLTAAVGRLGIVLLATPPDNWFSTAYYQDWLRLLTIHEYTHFLNMDATRGVLFESLRVVFGDAPLPNSLWPVWMLEGLAVYMETRYTPSGRGRSPYYDMILRAAVQDGSLDRGDFVTLDRVNGTSPYFPGGEIPYLFGYELMHQLTPQGDEVLGDLSERSSGQLPFFTGVEVEALTGRDWEATWNHWVSETRERSGAQLARIRSQALTTTVRLSEEGTSNLGSAASPDGRWLAFTQSSPDRRSGLMLTDLRSGKTSRVGDKMLGVSMSFTPDSRALIYSSLHQRNNYYLWSDLALYRLDDQSSQWLSDSLRARDPDISRDGKWVTFTVTENATTGVAVARLAPPDKNDDSYRIGTVRRAFWPAKYDRASTPKFSADGKRIVFTLHRNGFNGEDLMDVGIGGEAPRPLVRNGAYNRFPAFDPAGKLYFVSDISGVDNLFAYVEGGTPLQVTNVTTGLWLPSFGPSGLYASVFSSRGWDLSRVLIKDGPTVLTTSVTVEPPPAPAYFRAADAGSPAVTGPAKDYSIYPSILPRVWAPILGLDQQSLYAGARAYGFDQTDHHRYGGAAAYDTGVHKPDWSAYYTNHSFGPFVTFSASNQTTDAAYTPDNSLAWYRRELKFETDVAYPIRWTYSRLTPILAFKTSRETVFQPAPGGDRTLAVSTYVPSVYGELTYSNAESSRLSISPEAGHDLTVGAAYYADPSIPSWKGLAMASQYLRITDHSVLVPSARAMWTTGFNRGYASANAVATGRSNQLIGSMATDDFDQLALRGYPGISLYGRALAIPSLEYRFPIAQIYRGWGVNPLFFNYLSGFAFGETAVFPSSRGSTSLPSVGAGLKLSSTVAIQLPLILTAEYNRGFNADYGGKGEFFFGLNTTLFNF